MKRLAALLCTISTLAWGQAAFAAPSVVSLGGNIACGTGVTSCAVTIIANCPNSAGNYVYVDAGEVADNFTVTSFTDSRTNTYTALHQQDNASNATNAPAFAPVTTSLVIGDTITVNFAAGQNNTGIAAACMSGLATSSPLDVNPTGPFTGSSTAPAAATGALAGTGELVMGSFTAFAIATVTEASGFTIVVNNAPSGRPVPHIASQVAAGSGSVTATWGLSATGQWTASINAFKPAGGAGTPAPSTTHGSLTGAGS